MKDILFLNQWQESYKHYNKSVKETADHLGESISWAFTKEVTSELRLKKPSVIYNAKGICKVKWKHGRVKTSLQE